MTQILWDYMYGAEDEGGEIIALFTNEQDAKAFCRTKPELQFLDRNQSDFYIDAEVDISTSINR